MPVWTVNRQYVVLKEAKRNYKLPKAIQDAICKNNARVDCK